MSFGPFSKTRPKYDAHHLPILTHLIVYIPYVHDLSFAPRFEGYGGSPARAQAAGGHGGLPTTVGQKCMQFWRVPGQADAHTNLSAKDGAQLQVANVQKK